MGCHRNHAISHSPNQNLFEDTFVSHSGGPSEQFGTHEKLSWGGGGGVQGNLNWMPGYRTDDIYGSLWNDILYFKPQPIYRGVPDAFYRIHNLKGGLGVCVCVCVCVEGGWG